jgi:hypothetical protein
VFSLLAGAGCVLIMPYAAMFAAASTLNTSGPTPTVVTMSALIGVQNDDDSIQFMFFSMGSETRITYNADGTIENSLFAQPE